jgi:hypothetical protein
MPSTEIAAMAAFAESRLVQRRADAIGPLQPIAPRRERWARLIRLCRFVAFWKFPHRRSLRGTAPLAGIVCSDC